MHALSTCDCCSNVGVVKKCSGFVSAVNKSVVYGQGDDWTGERRYTYFGYAGNNNRSFEDADSVCRSIGANLASINLDDENKIVQDLCTEPIPGQRDNG